MQIDQVKSAILKDPAASYWLKDAIVSLDDRDVVDALHDSKTLVMFLQHKFSEIVTINQLGGV